jgi:signal transduction histidine kinase
MTHTAWSPATPVGGVDLASLVEARAARHLEGRGQPPVRLVRDPSLPLVAGDPAALTRVLDELFAHARSRGQSGAGVLVELNHLGASVELAVTHFPDRTGKAPALEPALHSVRRLVEQQGGRLRAVELDGLSTVRVELPRAQRGAERTAANLRPRTT